MIRKFAAVAAGALLLSTAAQARDQIQIVGSSTVYPFTTIVAEKLGQKGFKTPIVESTGTGGGMKLFCAGVGPNFPDMNNASRAIKGSEKELCASNGVTDIIELQVGNDGIAFANSVKAQKLNFTAEQLWMAMAEKGPKPTRWNEIDPALPNVEIKILAPPPTSGTRDAWNSLIMSKGCDSAVKSADKDECELFREDGAVEEAGENDTLIVNRLVADPEAFGIFGFSFLDQNQDRIQGSSINGVDISLDTIQTYEYPIARPLFFYVKKAHIGVIPGMKEMLDEYVSDAATGEYGYLGDAGLVPHSAAKEAEMRKRVQALTTLSM